MFKHILFSCTLGGSTHIAFDQMFEMARVFGSKVTLFHAYKLLNVPDSQLLSVGFRNSANQMETNMEDKASAYLSTFQAQLDKAGLENDLVIQRGHTGQLIVDLVENRLCDVIVMGRRSLDPFNSLLLGSTSTYVLHHCPCPVMILPQEKRGFPRE